MTKDPNIFVIWVKKGYRNIHTSSGEQAVSVPINSALEMHNFWPILNFFFDIREERWQSRNIFIAYHPSVTSRFVWKRQQIMRRKSAESNENTESINNWKQKYFICLLSSNIGFKIAELIEIILVYKNVHFWHLNF